MHNNANVPHIIDQVTLSTAQIVLALELEFEMRKKDVEEVQNKVDTIKNWVAIGKQDVTDAWELGMEEIDRKSFRRREKAHHVITLKVAKEALVSATDKIRQIKSLIDAKQ